MVAKPLTISIPEEQLSFIEEQKETNPSFSASKVMQSSLTVLMERQRFNPELIEERKISALKQKQIERLQKIIQQYVDFLTKRDLIKDFDKENPI